MAASYPPVAPQVTMRPPLAQALTIDGRVGEPLSATPASPPRRPPLVGRAGRGGHDVDGRDHHQLGLTAPAVLAHQAVVGTEVVLARKTADATAAGEPGVDHHPVPLAHADRARAQAGDDAADVGARD